MRKLLIVLLVIVIALLVVIPVFAHGPCAEEDTRPGNSEYGRDHIAGHAREGIGGDGHVPGVHQGFSRCNPSGH